MGGGAWSHHSRIRSRSSRATQHTFRPPLHPPPIPHPLQSVLMRLQSSFFPALQEPLFVPAAIRHQTAQSFLPHWSQTESARSELRQDAGYHRLFVLIATLNSSARMSHQPLTPKYIYICICNFHILNIRLPRLRTVYRWKNAGEIKVNISASGCFQDTSGHSNTSVHPPGFLQR